MEGRKHTSDSYNSQGQQSRMMQDLSRYSENLLGHFQQRLAGMNRKNIINTAEKRRNLRVGVIGAGLAGLRCAEVLIGEGIDVTIIEARDRLGGRVSSSRST